MSQPDAASLDRIESALRLPPAPGVFGDDEIEGLPEAVQAYLRWAIAPGTPLARAADLTMRGRLKLGPWVPFTATETLAPHEGFVWPARAMGVIVGSDHCIDGVSVMDWRVLGRWSVVHAEGPDVSRSASNRGAAEAVWVPTALLPRFGVVWEAFDGSHLCARFTMGEHPVELHLHVEPGTGRLLRFHLERWGDPDGTGTWHRIPFGGDATGWATFGGVTVPSAGRIGWWYGGPAFTTDGEFFRYELTDLRLVR